MKKLVILFSILALTFCSGGKNTSETADHEHGNAAHTHEGETADPAQQETEEAGHTQQAGEAVAHTHEGEEAGHTHEGEAEAPTPEGEEAGHEHQDLEVTPAKQKAWGIRVGQVENQQLSSQIVLPGVISLNENKTAHVTSFIHGQIAKLSVDLGSKVRKGQTIVVINSPDFAQIQADFLQTRAAYNLSHIEYERAQSLWKNNAIGENELLRRQAEHEKLSSEYGALGSKLHSLGITHEQIEELIQKCDLIEEEEYKCDVANPNLSVLAPLSGTVIFRNVILGQHIEPEEILFTVSDLSTVWVVLDAYEKDIPFINKESVIHIYSDLYSDRHFHGKITYISDLIDEKLRTLKIRVEVDNSEGYLKPNMYIRGIIENAASEGELLAVPDEAVQNLEGEKVVFIQEKSDVFAVRHVRLGNKVGPNRIILAGLEKGDRIVTKGAFTLKSEITKGTFGHAHVH
jgi:cobalt-zinc-cadmium efflux system membrane fusion protein